MSRRSFGVSKNIISREREDEIRISRYTPYEKIDAS